MTHVDERKARIAGQIAAIDAICEAADTLTARELNNLCNRAKRIHPTRRPKLRGELADAVATAALAGNRDARRFLGWSR